MLRYFSNRFLRERVEQSAMLRVGCKLFLLTIVVSLVSPSAAQSIAAPTYVGEAVCATCHDTAVWAQSRHSKMVQPATDEGVRGDFTRSRIILRGKPYLLEHRAGEFFITETYLSAKPQRHKVQYTLGNRRIQHYLTTLADGKVIVLPPTWDVLRKQWFHNLDIDDPEEEPGVLVQVWNKQCYSCHVSREQKQFDTEKSRYDTTWMDFGVNCERCHGPGSAHVARHQSGAPAASASAPDIVVQTRLDPARNTAVCAQCHSFRDIMVDGFTAGSNYYDYFRPVLEFGLPSKEDPSYWADGRTRRFSSDAIGLWQSECFLKGGVTCVQCHVVPHNTNVDKNPQLRADNAALCTRCHGEIGKNVAAHTHHAAESAGSSCVDCHMPRTVYSIKAQIRDHSMSVPAPENTLRHGIPNACNLCHKDRTPQWAQAKVKEWYGDQAGQKWIRRADAFSAARQGDAAAIPQLLAIFNNPAEGPFARANAAGYLGKANDYRAYSALIGALNDPEPLVRSVAVLAIRPGPSQRPTMVLAIAPMLADPVATVRISAAVALVNFGIRQLPGETGERFEQAKQLFRARADLDSDDPGQQIASGKFFLLDGDPLRAIAAFRACLKLDPTAPAQYLLADAYLKAGETTEARRILQGIGPRNPQYAEARRLLQEITRTP
jgi:predicted CXXCH cytochrome family protein